MAGNEMAGNEMAGNLPAGSLVRLPLRGRQLGGTLRADTAGGAQRADTAGGGQRGDTAGGDRGAALPSPTGAAPPACPRPPDAPPSPSYFGSGSPAARLSDLASRNAQLVALVRAYHAAAVELQQAGQDLYPLASSTVESILGRLPRPACLDRPLPQIPPGLMPDG